MTDDVWETAGLDLDAYLAMIGVERRDPTLDALEELHRAHVRTFTFDNIDVLLGQHAGVSLDAVQRKFVGRGRGGYCFEHATIFAASLAELGYAVERRLGRVGAQARTHAVVIVALEGRNYLTDPGFTLTISQPIELRNGAYAIQGGWEFQVREIELGSVSGWELHRRNGMSWDLLHTHDELPVLPIDFAAAHHFTSTHPDIHFRHRLMVSRHLDGTHVTISHDAVTIRRPQKPTEHRAADVPEILSWLRRLDVVLTAPEEKALHEQLQRIRG